MTDAFEDFLLARSMKFSQMLDEVLAISKESLQLDIHKKNMMSVNVPVMNFNRSDEYDMSSIYPYGFCGTSSELDEAVKNLYAILPELLKLAEIEKTCQLMADEIEITIRKVNALEYRIIPQFEETITYIKMKLEKK